MERLLFIAEYSFSYVSPCTFTIDNIFDNNIKVAAKIRQKDTFHIYLNNISNISNSNFYKYLLI